MAIIKTTDNDKLEFDSAISELREYFSSLGARKGRPLTYNVLTYGCQLNESDSEKLSGMLLSMGLTASSGGELDDADVIVFNTCSIRENADRHLFGNLGVFKTLKKNDRDVVIAVGGCMMKVPENVERHMLHRLCGPPSIPLSFSLATVLPRWDTYLGHYHPPIRQP